MKLIHKLILGFSTVVLLSWITGYLAVNFSEEILEKTFIESVEYLAVEILDGIEGDLQNKIEIFQEYSRDVLLQKEILRSNEQFKELKKIQAYINKKDKEWLATPKEKINLFMQNLIDNDVSNELREKINFYEDKYGYNVFPEVFATNIYGANVAQTGKTTDYRQDDERWWQIAKKDGLYVGSIAYDESADVYSTDIGIRIDDKNSNFIGSMKVVVNIERVFDLIENIEPIGIFKENKTMEYKIITKDGKLIYSTEDFEFLEDVSHLLSELGLLAPELGNVKVKTINNLEHNGNEIIITHAQSVGFKDFNLEWILLVEQEAKELFTPVTKLKKRILTTSLIVTLVGILIGLFISDSISRTFSNLMDAIARIGKGDLDAKIEVKSKDEIGQLAVAFKQMADDLKNTTVKRDELVLEIAERKKIEEALRQSQELFLTVFQISPFIMTISTIRDGCYVMVNKSFEQFTGYQREEVIGKTSIELGIWIRPEDRGELINVIFEDNMLKNKEIQMKDKSGEIHYLLFSGVAIEYDGAPHILTVATDITERKRTEEAVLNIARGVSAKIGEEFFHSLTKHLADILKANYAYIAEVIPDEPDHVRTLSLIADGKSIDNIKVDLTGTPCKTVLEKNLYTYPSGVQRLFPHALMMAEMKVEGYAGTRLVGSNGRKLGIMAVMYRKPVKDIEMVESMLQIFASRAAAEIERRQAEENLIKAKAEIEGWNKELEERVQKKTEELVRSQAQLIQSEKLSAMGHMAGGLAHELNSPLAGLLPMVEKYRDTVDKDSEAFRELTLMLKACKHMANIIKDFSSFSRESKGEFYKLNLNKVIEDTLSFSAVKLRSRNIQVDKQFTDILLPVEGVKTELQQVILNIINNASDAMPDGGKFIIKTYVSKDKNKVIMVFVDNGTGIEKEHLDIIFDPFFTTKKEGEGTGLGLSVSYGIIKKHKGEISVESTPGKGTKFTIYLPAVKV